MTIDQVLRDVVKKYDLFYDKNNPASKKNDIFVHKHYTIITRSGIEKIQASLGIHHKFNITHLDLTKGREVIAMEGLFWSENHKMWNSLDSPLQTFASVSTDTTSQKYFMEICEKRALSRGILKFAGLYALGIFGEDESDDFKKDKVNVR